MFYAAVAGRSPKVFAALFDHAVRPRGGGADADGVLRAEMVCRALHDAARGGDLEMMRRLLDGERGGSADGDVLLGFRDAQGSTLLHAASGRGQLEENPDLWKWLTGQEQPPDALNSNPVFAAVRSKVAENLNHG